MSEANLGIGENDGIGQPILCPVCRSEYNHGIDQRKTDAVLFFDGQDSYKAGWSERGNLVAVQMQCETGHRWELCVGFHKGTMYLFARGGHSHK